MHYNIRLCLKVCLSLSLCLVCLYVYVFGFAASPDVCVRPSIVGVQEDGSPLVLQTSMPRYSHLESLQYSCDETLCLSLYISHCLPKLDV